MAWWWNLRPTSKRQNWRKLPNDKVIWVGDWKSIFFWVWSALISGPTLQVDSLPAEPQEKPKNTGVGSLSLLWGIFLTQESNQGLLHCRWILYQLSYQGSPLTNWAIRDTLNWKLSRWESLQRSVGSRWWISEIKCNQICNSDHSGPSGRPSRVEGGGSDGCNYIAQGFIESSGSRGEETQNVEIVC